MYFSHVPQVILMQVVRGHTIKQCGVEQKKLLGKETDTIHVFQNFDLKGVCNFQTFFFPALILFESISYSVMSNRLFATPGTVACQTPLFMGFSRQEPWSGQPFHSPGGLPDPGIELGSPAMQATTHHLSSERNPLILFTFIYFFTITSPDRNLKTLVGVVGEDMYQ